MASSVSSERAFSSAGITFSKRRNRLRHDIVVALQFLKCALRTDLIFRERPPSFELEDQEDVVADDETLNGRMSLGLNLGTLTLMILTMDSVPNHGPQ
jgi:hAT family C-terminal dimerisation region